MKLTDDKELKPIASLNEELLVISKEDLLIYTESEGAKAAYVQQKYGGIWIDTVFKREGFDIVYLTTIQAIINGIKRKELAIELETKK